VAGLLLEDRRGSSTTALRPFEQSTLISAARTGQRARENQDGDESVDGFHVSVSE
jgi:hypothetical protein